MSKRNAAFTFAYTQWRPGKVYRFPNTKHNEDGELETRRGKTIFFLLFFSHLKQYPDCQSDDHESQRE